MKLNAVAGKDVANEGNGEGNNRVTKSPLGAWVFGIVGIAGAFCLLTASPALALDGIDISEPAEATAPGGCPKLIQIKYPFISCQDDEIGLADGDATWENSRQIPIQSDFIEGNGYWGEELNRD